MNQSTAPTTTTATFVIRFTREPTAGEVRWRGSIEHVESGERAAFLELAALLSFLRRFGITVEDQKRSERWLSL
jgi:acyl-coenzyme A thioesterase PaaI-like protein